jgi:glycerol-3-phosphate dehydrogenase
MRYDVIIIGGGVVGCAIGRELMRYQVTALLLEKQPEVGFGTSKANSGIIHGGQHASPSTLKGQLEWAGNQRWDSLCDELGFGFTRCGELTIALHEDQRPVLHKLLDQGRKKGVPGLEIWEREQILTQEPNLTTDVVAALYAPTTGVVNPYEACFALIESAHFNGLEVQTNAPVSGLQSFENGWLVQTPVGQFHSRYVINAAGLYADTIAEMAGVATFKIHPRKGEEYLLDKRISGIVKHVIFPCPTPVSKGILVIPTYDGTIMVGPTADPVDSKEDFTTSSAGAEEIFTAVKAIVPGISERDCIAEFAGLRAVADGEDFIIGPTPKRGFINVAGIQSPGLTASPAIAEHVVQILQDEGLAMAEKRSFVSNIPKPIHFAALSTAEQVKLAAHKDRYRRIVCRCEMVTEGEVVDAIERGSHTLDGLKFRTRAGMGRCQGGFCTWRCLELLSQELQLPITAITKRGGDSWIVCPPCEEVEA